MYKILKSLYITTETQRLIEALHCQGDGKGLCLHCSALPQSFINKIFLTRWYEKHEKWKHLSPWLYAASSKGVQYCKKEETRPENPVPNKKRAAITNINLVLQYITGKVF